MTKVFHIGGNSCYIDRKPRGSVRKNTIGSAFATPNVMRGFVMPKFCRKMRLRTHSYWLRGMVGAIRKDVRTAEPVFLTTMLHPMRVRTHRVANLSRSGVKTMTTSSLASRCAAATSPTLGTSDPIKLHADARNALSMAVFYLSQPQANVVGARRKAVQALSALRGLDLSLEG